MAVITGIEHDHPENYTGLDAHLDAYARFADGIASCGSLVISADDPGAAELTRRLRDSRPDLRVVTYGEAPGADWHITCITVAGMSSQVTVITPDGHPVTVNLPVPGKVMAVNAIAALAAAAQAGVPAGAAAIALGSYRGIRGRLTVRGEAASGVLVLDSYAHHPAAIAADLEAARTLACDGQVITVFQPCGYTRTAAMAPAMAIALKGADMAVVLDIHASVGPPVPGVTSSLITDAGTGQLASPSEAVKQVTAAADPSDVVLVMGTGTDLDLLAEADPRRAGRLAARPPLTRGPPARTPARDPAAGRGSSRAVERRRAARRSQALPLVPPGASRGSPSRARRRRAAAGRAAFRGRRPRPGRPYGAQRAAVAERRPSRRPRPALAPPTATRMSMPRPAASRPACSCPSRAESPSSAISPRTAIVRCPSAIPARVWSAAATESGLALNASLTMTMPSGRSVTSSRPVALGRAADSASAMAGTAMPAPYATAAAPSALPTWCPPRY